MTDRLVSDAALAPSSRLVGQPLASPLRRIVGFAFDCMLLVVPSLLVAVVASAIPRSAGTFGLGLLDFWREPNRRLAHDRLSNTVVVRRNAVVCVLIAAAIAAASAAAFAFQEMPANAVRELYQAALAAYQKKDYAGYLQKIEAVAAQRPAHPTFLRRLAGAYALNGRAPAAAGVLRNMAALSLYYN